MFKPGYEDECMAFALATGMVDLDNSQAGIEKAARRARHARPPRRPRPQGDVSP